MRLQWQEACSLREADCAASSPAGRGGGGQCPAVQPARQRRRGEQRRRRRVRGLWRSARESSLPPRGPYRPRQRPPRPRYQLHTRRETPTQRRTVHRRPRLQCQPPRRQQRLQPEVSSGLRACCRGQRRRRWRASAWPASQLPAGSRRRDQWRPRGCRCGSQWSSVAPPAGGHLPIVYDIASFIDAEGVTGPWRRTWRTPSSRLRHPTRSSSCT